MKKILCAVFAVSLILAVSLFLYVSSLPTLKYYDCADPMVNAFLEHRSVFQATVSELSRHTDSDGFRIETDPMDYIRHRYSHEVSMEPYTVLTNNPLQSDDYQALFDASVSIMDVTDVESITMRTDDALGITVCFTFFYDYGIYAELFYFENAPDAFPYEPAHPKDIQKIDPHWFACLSTDTFMAG